MVLDLGLVLLVLVIGASLALYLLLSLNVALVSFHGEVLACSSKVLVSLLSATLVVRFPASLALFLELVLIGKGTLHVSLALHDL